jgi:tripartite-type tricarboxylate transporter receptor subunit TctC
MKMKTTGLVVIGFLFTVAMSMAVSQALAKDEYPNKQIQLICPYAVGGITDLSARIIAEKMGEYLGQPVIVVNKPGAGAALGTGFVAASKPDGYTILTTWTGVAVLVPLITPNLPYKMTDLTPIGKAVSVDQLLLVNKDVPVKNLSELIAYAKQHPKTLSAGTAGVGTLPHLVVEQLNVVGQIDVQHIPYNSELQAVTALAGNHVQVSVLTLTIAEPHIKSGAVRPLALLAAKRDPAIPQVPTSVEQGYPALMASIYNILFTPAKTPAPILKRLEEDLEKTLRDSQTREKLEKMGYKIDYMNGRSTHAFLEAETRKWSSVVKQANIMIK